MVTGPSGVGKGTLIRQLLEHVPGLELSVSATTRAPRKGEVDGRDYHFLGAGEFERRVAAGEFLEHARYAGNLYGTPRSELDRDCRAIVLEIEIQGARQVREAVPDSVQIFIAPPSLDALRERLEGRGSDSPEQVTERLDAAVEEVLASETEFEHRIVNADLGRAVQDLVALVATILGRPRGETT